MCGGGAGRGGVEQGGARAAAPDGCLQGDPGSRAELRQTNPGRPDGDLEAQMREVKEKMKEGK